MQVDMIRAVGMNNAVVFVDVNTMINVLLLKYVLLFKMFDLLRKGVQCYIGCRGLKK